MKNHLEGCTSYKFPAILGLHHRNRIIEEVFSDIFAINTLFARHAPTWTAHSLVNYTGIVISALTNLLMLDLLKDDLIKANVDADHNTSHIEAGILELSHRHMALQGYLSDFDFGTETVVPVQEDNLPLISQSDDLMTSLSDANAMLQPFDEHSRRVASLVSLGFQSGFDAIVDACKTGYEFERWF